VLREAAAEEGEEQEWYEEGIQETVVQSHPTGALRSYRSASLVYRRGTPTPDPHIVYQREMNI